MYGFVIRRHGGLDALEWDDALPDRSPGPGQVRLRLRAVGINHLDLWVRRGVPGHRFPLPLVPGCDLVGEVEAAGPGAEDVDRTRRYLVAPGFSCMRCDLCLAGEHSLCRHYGILGETADGGYAEAATVPRENLIEIPSHLSWEEAASFPLAFLTAWHMLVTRARVRPGQTVLVQAAASGVGAAAVQIAKLLGAVVIAAARTPEKAAFARAQGADEALATAEQDLVTRVRELVGRGGVEVIVDHVGAATWDQDLALLRKGGTLVLCGATTGSSVQLDLRPLFFKAWSILGSTMGSLSEMRTVAELFRTRRLRPTLDRTLPLREAPEAHRLLEERRVAGKLVLRHP